MPAPVRKPKYTGPKMQSPEQIARNQAIAEATGRKLDSLGRLASGPGALGYMEMCTWTDPETGETEQRERRVPREEIRCTKLCTGRLNPWKGNRCAKTKIAGAEVCTTHGGQLPNVRKAAQRKLAMAALPAAERLIHMALKKQRMSDGDRLKALLAILDRAGVEGKTTVELEVKPWQTVLKKVYADLEGEEAPTEPEPEDDSEEGEDGLQHWEPDPSEDDEDNEGD